jgi:hypothetical protein
MRLTEVRLTLPLSVEEVRCRSPRARRPARAHRRPPRARSCAWATSSRSPSSRNSKNPLPCAAPAAAAAAARALTPARPQHTDSVKTIAYDAPGGGTGLYSEKVIALRSFAPAWAQRFVGSERLQVEARNWDEFPASATVYSVPLLGAKLKLHVLALYVGGDRGDLENALGLAPAQLAARRVVRLDIADDADADMRGGPPELDPKLVRSQRAGRGPLAPGWARGCEPVATLYKLIAVEVGVWGVQTRAEAFVTQYLQETYAKLHRLAFCWLDEWLLLDAAAALALHAPARAAYADVPRPPVAMPRVPALRARL